MSPSEGSVDLLDRLMRSNFLKGRQNEFCVDVRTYSENDLRNESKGFLLLWIRLAFMAFKASMSGWRKRHSPMSVTLWRKNTPREGLILAPLSECFRNDWDGRGESRKVAFFTKGERKRRRGDGWFAWQFPVGEERKHFPPLFLLFWWGEEGRKVPKIMVWWKGNLENRGHFAIFFLKLGHFANFP